MKHIYTESKVFLFGEQGWLYCNTLSFRDGVYRGNVINGAWHLSYDTKTKSLKCYNNREEERVGWVPITESVKELSWACGQLKGRGYTEVINNAEERYKNGEKANFDLEEYEVEDDGIPY